MNWRGATAACALVLTIGAPRRAAAIFGEEDWISGQNQLLTSMLVTELESTAHLGTIISQVVQAVRTANEMLAVARSVKRVYEAIVDYDLEALKRDALRGLYTAIPEARHLDSEVRELVGNGRALEGGHFWTHVANGDYRTQAKSKALFDLGYQSAIWPLVFGDRHKRPAPRGNPVDKALFRRYRRTGQLALQATQKGAYSVLAEQVRAFVEDAERKPQVDLKMSATQTELLLQQAQDTTELLELQKIDAAEQEDLRRGAADFHKSISRGLAEGAGVLTAPPGAKGTK